MSLATIQDLVGFESGVWTPAITFGGDAVDVTYGANTAGRYTKIGKLVICTFLIHISNKGSSTGAAVLQGLPFAASSTPPGGGLSTTWSTSIGASGTILGAMTAGTTSCPLYAATSGSAVALTNSVFSGSGLSQLQGLIIYEAE